MDIVKMVTEFASTDMGRAVLMGGGAVVGWHFLRATLFAFVFSAIGWLFKGTAKGVSGIGSALFGLANPSVKKFTVNSLAGLMFVSGLTVGGYGFGKLREDSKDAQDLIGKIEAYQSIKKADVNMEEINYIAQNVTDNLIPVSSTSVESAKNEYPALPIAGPGSWSLLMGGFAMSLCGFVLFSLKN